MNIVVFETETWAQTAWQRMKGGHEVRLLEEFLTLSNADEHVDANVISTDLSRLDAAILEKFKDLKLIARRSTDVDKIDLAYCAAHRITVCNVPDYAEIAVAEHVFALLLSISRHLSEAAERTRKGTLPIERILPCCKAKNTVKTILRAPRCFWEADGPRRTWANPRCSWKVPMAIAIRAAGIYTSWWKRRARAFTRPAANRRFIRSPIYAMGWPLDTTA